CNEEPGDGEQGNAAGNAPRASTGPDGPAGSRLGKAKSAAIDGLRENLIEALWLGFTRQEIWEALREVGDEGSYRYFGTKLHRLGITRSRVTSAAPFVRTIVSGRSGVTDASTAIAENEELSNSTEPTPLNEVEAQRRRLEEARRRGEIYRKPK